MPASVGSTVTIAPYDLVHHPDWPDPQVDDWVVTYSERTERWGTAYLIDSARKIRSTTSPRRFSLRCTVIGPAASAAIKDDEQVYPLVWYPRDRRRSR